MQGTVSRKVDVKGCSHTQLHHFNQEQSMLSKKLNSLIGHGDPLADAVWVDYQKSTPEVRALLEKGMRHGSSGIYGMPQSFQALLEDSEATLTLMDRPEFERALEYYAWLGPLWHSISLGPGSLVHTYSDPAIAAVLMKTGNLLDQTVARRLLETQIWNVSVIKPHGLSLGGSGYVHTLQVRMLHAQVRSSLLRRGWRHPHSPQAVPIDQLQMIRTWLDFTVVPFNSLDSMGLPASREQRQALYCLWRLIGRLLGIEPDLMAQISDHTVAQEMLKLVDGQLLLADDNSRILTKATLNAMGVRLAPLLAIPADVSVLLMNSMCRLFHGDAHAQRLGVDENWTSALLPMMADANRFRLRRLEEDYEYRVTSVSNSLQTYESIEKGLSNLTAYQAMSSGITLNDLPRIGSN
jgi:hypothetical protein